MSGPAPKPEALRRRRNKASTRAELDLSPKRGRKVKPLPPLRELLPNAKHADWHPMTRAWWADVWKSPMASQFTEADAQGLYRLAVLVDKFWRSPKKDLAGEIRLQQAEYGLTPLARRRLQWVTKQVDDKKPTAPRKRRPRVDPRESMRSAMKVVK